LRFRAKIYLFIAQKISKFIGQNYLRMNNAMNLSFQLKTAKKDENGQAPIYARITINGVRTEFSIKRFIDPSKWVNKAGIVRGTNEDARSINAQIVTVRTKLFQHYNQIIEAGKVATCETIKNAYFGISEKGKSIIEAYEYHNAQVKELIGKDFAAGTYTKYVTSLVHLKNYILWKYKVSDKNVKQIDFAFITEFEYYLKSVCNIDHNTSMKYITNLKKIVRICRGNGWLDHDPFINYKITKREVERDFLSDDELMKITNKHFSIERLMNVRDIFLFSCYTGLAYADVKKLSKVHILVGIDGGKWIKINRTKTDTRSSIPLLPTAEALIEKYSQDPKCVAANILLPVLSNQKMNSYLKEIADVCGINKNITFHLARHTFATTVTLSNHVPIESVSKMLGHRSIKTTQQYAKVLDRKISDDMQLLKEKMSLSNSTGKTKIA